MKNKLKLYLTLWVVLFTFLNVNAQCETIMKFFKDDVYTSKELVAFAEKNPQKAFDSWKVLYNEKNSLTKNLEELTLVSKNLEAIKSAKGYLNWKALQGASNIVTELTQTTKNHLKYGEIKIIIKNSSTGDIISTSVRKPIDPPISVPSSGVNVSVDVSGIHFENALKTGLIEEVANTRNLVKTLPSGEQIFKSKIKVFVQEINNGQGGWKTVANEKTWWPSVWNDQKVWEKISEAFSNKVNIQGSKWHGTTVDGVKIEMYLDVSGNISTAYLIP